MFGTDNGDGMMVIDGDRGWRQWRGGTEGGGNDYTHYMLTQTHIDYEMISASSNPQTLQICNQFVHQPQSLIFKLKNVVN